MAELDLSGKAESLADKMNKLTAKFDLAEELILDGDDIIDFVDEKTKKVDLYESETENNSQELITSSDLINLNIMVEDFKYIRDTLKETTDNGRSVLNVITVDLLESDDDKRAALILSFAELNRAVGDNMKLYMQSYKDISTVLLNLDKIKKNEKSENINVTNNLNVVNNESISTVDLIKKLSGK
jgi:hypothetical protein